MPKYRDVLIVFFYYFKLIKICGALHLQTLIFTPVYIDFDNYMVKIKYYKIHHEKNGNDYECRLIMKVEEKKQHNNKNASNGDCYDDKPLQPCKLFGGLHASFRSL